MKYYTIVLGKPLSLSYEKSKVITLLLPTLLSRKYMHAETLADKTIVFSEREVFKVVVMVTQ